MSDVVIIGGGLSGLAAADELQKLQIPYRLIEVKKRLGGSIASRQQDRFVLDSGAFAFSTSDDWSFLAKLGLDDALCPIHDSHSRDAIEASENPVPGRWAAFKNGTQTLISAFEKRLTGTILRRMAVSSLGELEGRFTLCMENGLVFSADALIVAAPARFAERMFRTLQPDISQRLFDYHYDTITRISLGYRREDIPLPPSLPWDMAVPFCWWTDYPQRVPRGHVLLQVGIRTPPALAASEALIQTVHEALKAQKPPVVARADYWPEADPLPPHMRNFPESMAALQALVPRGIALVGSDYNGISLGARIAAGGAAARKIAQEQAK